MSGNLIKSFILAYYDRVFARPCLAPFHRLAFKLALRGLGVSIGANKATSGERYLLQTLSGWFDDVTVVDVGAHRGEYTKLVMSCIPDAAVYSLEPNPRSYGVLSELSEHLDFKAFHNAVGRSETEVTLWDYANTFGGSQHSSVYRRVIEDIHGQDAEGFSVQETTLDGFCKRQNLSRVNLLKIDTEGNELSVLDGAERMIGESRIDVIQLEFNEMNIVSKTFMWDILQRLSEYKLYRLLPNSLLPLEKYSAKEWELFAYQNIVAVRDGLGLP